jgi:hypothetical protein
MRRIQMKITKTRLTQIIKEELARLTEAHWDHPPEPAGSLGGYGDSDDIYADPNPPPVETSIHQDFADLQMGMRNPYTPWEMLSGGGRQRRLEAALTNNPGLEERLRKAANDIRAPGAQSHGDLKAIGNAFFEELSVAIEKEYA